MILAKRLKRTSTRASSKSHERSRANHRPLIRITDAQSHESHINYLAALKIGSLNGGMKTTPTMRLNNVRSFILEGRWPLAGFDQRELRRLSKKAMRNGVGVADVLYEAVESFVAKCEAEADLEQKVINFPTVAQRSSRDGSPRLRSPSAIRSSRVRCNQRRATVRPL
jgi:hypothetical protein